MPRNINVDGQPAPVREREREINFIINHKSKHLTHHSRVLEGNTVSLLMLHTKNTRKDGKTIFASSWLLK